MLQNFTNISVLLNKQMIVRNGKDYFIQILISWIDPYSKVYWTLREIWALKGKTIIDKIQISYLVCVSKLSAGFSFMQKL